MSLLVWPYVEYHNLRVKAGAFLQANYPLFVERVEYYWQLVKVFGKESHLEWVSVFVRPSVCLQCMGSVIGGSIVYW